MGIFLPPETLFHDFDSEFSNYQSDQIELILAQGVTVSFGQN
jgi:hypothetical protein